MKLSHLLMTGVAAIAMSSSASMALDATAKVESTIKALPDEGHVAISGKVKRVVNENKFILQDETGKTIDVNTSAKHNVKVGETVSVSATADDEFLGMGDELVDATVTKGISAEAKAAAKAMKDTPTAKAAMKAEQKAQEKKESEWKESRVEADAEAKGKIANLPEKGDVNFTAIVESVDDDGESFIVRDNTGNTIDVHLKEDAKVALKKGDHVRIKGAMEDEALGLGEEVKADSVIVISAKANAKKFAD